MYYARRKKRKRDEFIKSFGASCGDGFKRRKKNRVGIGLSVCVIILCRIGIVSETRPASWRCSPKKITDL